MRTPYDEAIGRITANRMANPIYAEASRNLAKYNIQAGKAKSDARAIMTSKGAGFGTIMSATNQMNQAIGEQYNTGFNEAATQENARQSTLIDKETTLLTERNKYVKQQEEQNAAKKDGMIKTLMQVGGAAAGIALNPLTGGLSGAVLPGLTGMASGFVGNGQLALDQADPATILQGAADTISGLSSFATNKITAKMDTDVGTFMASPAYKAMMESPEGYKDIANFTAMLQGGNHEALYNFMKTKDPNNAYVKPVSRFFR